MPKPCDPESLLNRVTQAAGVVSAKQIADPSAGLLLDMGISPNLKGYHYLLEAIALAQGGAVLQ